MQKEKQLWKKKKKTKENIQEQKNNYKRCNTSIMGIPEEEELIQAKNFPKFMTDNKSQFQKSQKTSSLINTKKSTARHIMFKLKKTTDKEKTWKKSGDSSSGVYLWRYKENNLRLLIKNHACKKRVQ